MILINLLPHREEKRKRRKAAFFVGLGMSFVVGLLIAAFIYLLLQQRCRFAALRAGIPDITDRMLSERLQELEEEEIVARTVVPATPVRVEYSLTQKGHALAKAMDAIGAWANDWLRAEEPPVIARPPKTTRRRAPKKATSRSRRPATR